MKAGDVLAFSGDGLTSNAIKYLTFGLRHSISHVGILANHDGRLRLFESTFERGLEVVPIRKRLQEYVGRAWHYPLCRDLYDFENERLSQFVAERLGTPYDLQGAFRAGGFLLASAKAKSTRPDLSRMFCSEAVAACHNAVGIFHTSNPSRFSPNSLIRAERQAGVLLTPERLK